MNGSKGCAMRNDSIINCDSYLFSIDEAKTVLRIGKDKLNELIATGEIPVITVTGCKRIPHSGIKQFLNKNLLIHKQEGRKL